MHRIGGGGDEIKSLIEALGLVVLRMHRECADAGNVGRLERALHGVPQECLPYALALRTPRYRQACKQHDWHRMPRQSFCETFRRFLASDLAYGKGVVADDRIPDQANISLGRSRLLVGQAYLSK